MASTSLISLYPRISETKNGKQIPIDLFLDYIQEGKFQDDVLAVRTRKKEKKQIPYVTLSGIFEGRTDKGLKEHSGFIGIDLDDVDPNEIKSELCNDPYVFALFTSVSGTGLCAIFKINGEKHREAFGGISEYLYENYRLITDPTSVNPSRARFISYDPDLFRNLHAQKFCIYPKQKQVKLPTTVFAQNDFDELIKQIQQRNLNICDSYYEWVRIGFGLAEKFGEDGRNYFHIISSASHKYKSKDCDRQYTNCLKAKGTKQATIATFYFYCKQAGLSLYTKETKTIISSAISAKKGGRDAKSVQQLLTNFEEIPAEISAPIIEQVFNNPITDTPEEGLINEVELYFKQNYNFRRNEVTRYIEDNGKILKQADFNSIFIATKKIYDKVSYELVERMINSNITPTYNPLKEFFANNEHINTVGNIKKLFSSVETDDSEFLEYFGTKWMVGVIASVYGSHSPLMLILSGKIQNTGKTQFFRRLPPPDLKPYFGESKLDAGKDDEILMTQKLWIYDDEMSGKSKKDANKIKDLLSKQTFSLREPYGKNNVDLERIAVLCASSNDDLLLIDPTGNRRFIPANVISINHELYNSINKTELWMEAYHLYKSGFDWELSKEDIKRMEPNNAKFENYSMEYELISKFYSVPNDVYTYVTASDIKVEIESKTNQRLIPEKIGREMIRLGFEKTTQRINGMPRKCYKVFVVGGSNLDNFELLH